MKRILRLLAFISLIAVCFNVAPAQRKQRARTLRRPNPPALAPIEATGPVKVEPPVSIPAVLPFEPARSFPSAPDRAGYADKNGDPGIAADYGPTTSDSPLTERMVRESAQALLKEFGREINLPIHFENEPAAPLTIVEAHVELERWDKTGPSSADNPAPDEDAFVIAAKIKLMNIGSRRIKAFGLSFGYLHYGTCEKPLRVSRVIEAGEILEFTKRHEDHSSYFLISPKTVTVKVAGVEFENGSAWGNPLLPGEYHATTLASVVDMQAVPLNSPKPAYTEEARAHKTEGVVTLRVLVGQDGYVKQARITHGLPDGLNEQAIQSAYNVRFRPALKNGEPVSFWQTMQIEFRLQ